MGIASSADYLDATVIRMEKTYPAYFGTYDRFHVIREFVDRYHNLFLVGRNGMHKYNNQDHSMLTAMTAVDNIVEGRRDKANIWAVNTEMDYHESRERSLTMTPARSAPLRLFPERRAWHSARMESGLSYGWSLADRYWFAGGKSGLHRAACRLTAGGVRSKRISRKVPQKIYRRESGASSVFGKGEKVR